MILTLKRFDIIDLESRHDLGEFFLLLVSYLGSLISVGKEGRKEGRKGGGGEALILE